MTRVSIEYCVPCGHLDQAIDTQRALLETYGRTLDGVTLLTGENGVFEVAVDGELVFDKSEEGYDQEAIVERVGDHLD
jgi:selenoprotein W-related protein